MDNYSLDGMVTVPKAHREYKPIKITYLIVKHPRRVVGAFVLFFLIIMGAVLSSPLELDTGGESFSVRDHETANEVRAHIAVARPRTLSPSPAPT